MSGSPVQSCPGQNILKYTTSCTLSSCGYARLLRTCDPHIRVRKVFTEYASSLLHPGETDPFAFLPHGVKSGITYNLCDVRGSSATRALYLHTAKGARAKVPFSAQCTYLNTGMEFSRDASRELHLHLPHPRSGRAVARCLAMIAPKMVALFSHSMQARAW